MTTPQRFTSVEARLDAAAHAVLVRLPATGWSGAMVEFVVFGIKQGWAALFGGALLGLIMITRLGWFEAMPIARYDFLFLAAIALQAAMLGFKLETWSEARVILIFHIVGTLMELFKTAAGSWTYPDPSCFHLGNVPLFSGFMYAAVGSYMARINRIFDIRLTNYPPRWLSVVLAALIYINFFAHHFLPDIRYGLFVAVFVIFLPVSMHYRVHRSWHRMPLLVAFLLVTFFIWIAENIGTLTRTWVYPRSYAAWLPVGPDKFGSWFLLMIISVVLVTLVHPPRTPDRE